MKVVDLSSLPVVAVAVGDAKIKIVKAYLGYLLDAVVDVQHIVV